MDNEVMNNEKVIDLYIRYYNKLLVAFDVTEKENGGYKQEASRVALELVREALSHPIIPDTEFNYPQLPLLVR